MNLFMTHMHHKSDNHVLFSWHLMFVCTAKAEQESITVHQMGKGIHVRVRTCVFWSPGNSHRRQLVAPHPNSRIMPSLSYWYRDGNELCSYGLIALTVKQGCLCPPWFTKSIVDFPFLMNHVCVIMSDFDKAARYIMKHWKRKAALFFVLFFFTAPNCKTSLFQIANTNTVVWFV